MGPPSLANRIVILLCLSLIAKLQARRNAMDESMLIGPTKVNTTPAGGGRCGICGCTGCCIDYSLRNLAGSVGPWPTVYNQRSPFPRTAQFDLFLNVNLQFDRLVLCVVNLADVHCERLE